MDQLIISDVKMTSLDIAEVTGKRHDNVMSDIRKEIKELGEETSLLIFKESTYKNSRGREYPCYEFGKDGAMQLALKYDAKTRYEVIKYVERLEQRTNKPQSIEDLIIMQAQSVKEIKDTVNRQGQVIETVNHRLDNIDSLDTIGDLQQRLNAMVRRYAQDKGISFGNAWRDFRTSFNVAYRTNLKLLMNNYKDKHNLTSLTMPQYLSLVERLPDAIRVADKMLNKELV